MQNLSDNYSDRDVVALVINVMEDEAVVTRWAEQVGWTLPVLSDRDGAIATAYAPPDLLPDIPRNQIPIASNLIVDAEGRIRFYSLLDSRNFDARLITLRAVLDRLLEKS